MSRSTERAERRALELEKRRKQRKVLQNNSVPNPDRRRFLMLAGAGLALAATGGIAYRVKELIEPEKSDEEIILAEAKRLGALQDVEEQRLWQDAYKHNADNISPDPNSAQVSDRVFSTLALMTKSKNPHFKKAAEDLFDMIQGGRVKIYKLADWQIDASAGVAWGPKEDGDFEFELNVDPEFVLNGSSALTLAGTLTHEVWHLRRYEQQLFNAMGLNPEEQTAYLHDFNARNVETEEAFAYGREADAYIYQSGLMGSTYNVDISGQENRAVRYIQLGSNSESREWKNYIFNIGGVH